MPMFDLAIFKFFSKFVKPRSYFPPQKKIKNPLLMFLVFKKKDLNQMKNKFPTNKNAAAKSGF
jgi:hypothetical protein